MASLPYITASDVPAPDWVAIADAMEAGHKGAPPELGDQFLHRGGDTLLSRAAWIDGMGVGVKSVTVMPGNAAKGRPSVQGAMLVFDDATGAPRALIDSALITRWKTAGDSVLGARLLARSDSRTLLIVGAGAVADSLIEAYRAVFPQLERITLWNRTTARAQELASAHKGVEVATDLAAAVADADIVATCTMAKSPVVMGEWLRPGTHLDLIGAFTADMREVDDAALTRSSIFVDSRETTLDHIGELMIPLRAGVIGRDAVKGDFFDLVAGRTGRNGPRDITVFKNGGGAHLDLMTAGVILKAAGL